MGWLQGCKGTSHLSRRSSADDSSESCSILGVTVVQEVDTQKMAMCNERERLTRAQSTPVDVATTVAALYRGSVHTCLCA